MRKYPKPNRYANKRKHKRLQKKQYARRDGIYSDNLNMMEQECLDEYERYPWRGKNRPNNGYEYWQTMYLSGPRQYAKWCTNRAIRAYYRDQIRKLDEEMLDDLQGLQGADYEKMFDYLWTVW
jgi:hypothetical protein